MDISRKVSYEKTEYMEYKHQGGKHIEMKHGSTYQKNWEVEICGGQPKELFDKDTNRYNKQEISYKTKLRHYSTVVSVLYYRVLYYCSRARGLYASEFFTLYKTGEQQEIEKKER